MADDLAGPILRPTEEPPPGPGYPEPSAPEKAPEPSDWERLAQSKGIDPGDHDALARMYREMESAHTRMSNRVAEAEEISAALAAAAREAEESSESQNGAQRPAPGAPSGAVDWGALAAGCMVYNPETGENEMDFGAFASLLVALSGQTGLMAARQEYTSMIEELREGSISPIQEERDELAMESVADYAREIYGDEFGRVADVAGQVVEEDGERWESLIDSMGYQDAMRLAYAEAKQLIDADDSRRQRTEGDAYTLRGRGRGPSASETRLSPAQAEKAKIFALAPRQGDL